MQDDLAFELVGIGPVVGLVEGVAHVVDVVLEERGETRLVEVLVGGVSHLALVHLLDSFKQAVQSGFDVVLGGHGGFILDLMDVGPGGLCVGAVPFPWGSVQGHALVEFGAGVEFRQLPGAWSILFLVEHHHHEFLPLHQ